MTHEQIIWMYSWLCKDSPTQREIELGTRFICDKITPSAYIQIDPRMSPGNEGAKKHLVVYSSCHAEQLHKYLNHYRQDVLDEYYLHLVFSHCLQLARPESNSRILWELFRSADVIICNILSHKFQEFSTEALFRSCKPSCRIVSFVPPSCACWWPTAPHYGEEPVRDYMHQGVQLGDMIDRFGKGTFDCRFNFRFKDQIDRLAYRERNRDVKISQYIMRNYRTHKMFFTYNHPTFHLISYIADECLGLLGYKKFGEEHTLYAPVNFCNWGNHYCETDYEWEFYGFEYPKRFTEDYGGPSQFYPAVITDIFNRRTANGDPFVDPEDDY